MKGGIPRRKTKKRNKFGEEKRNRQVIGISLKKQNLFCKERYPTVSAVLRGPFAKGGMYYGRSRGLPETGNHKAERQKNRQLARIT